MNHISIPGKVKAAGFGVVTTLTLTVVKLAFGIFLGSMAIIAEAVHSGMDLVSALIGFFAVRQSSIPEDESHPYGHGKYEMVAGGIEALLIIIASGSLIFFGVKDVLAGPHPIEVGLGVWVMLGSAAVNYGVAKYLFSAAKKYDSFAIEGNAWHLTADVWPSLGVVVGLIALKILKWYWIDPVIAILIGVYIGVVGFRLTGRAFKGLVDHSLPAEEEAKIRAIVCEYYPVVLEFHKLRTRKSGNERHVDLHFIMKRDARLDNVHTVCDQIEEEIEKCFPNVKILTHVEPCQDLGICETEECPDVRPQSIYKCPLDEPNHRDQHLKQPGQ
ncbi:MAG: cation diffusion facilitator family transporter [Chloroflexi bacterium]|nr:cation diffusion facilitator family transporter [Chloroflexota bacterium]